jgi:hypothetical protein
MGPPSAPRGIVGRVGLSKSKSVKGAGASPSVTGGIHAALETENALFPARRLEEPQSQAARTRGELVDNPVCLASTVRSHDGEIRLSPITRCRYNIQTAPSA